MVDESKWAQTRNYKRYQITLLPEDRERLERIRDRYGLRSISGAISYLARAHEREPEGPRESE